MSITSAKNKPRNKQDNGTLLPRSEEAFRKNSIKNIRIPRFTDWVVNPACNSGNQLM